MKTCKRRRAPTQRPASSLQRFGPAVWVVALAAGATGLAQALDLGDAKARLVLGQPLRVDLPLLLSPGESTEDLQVSVRGRAALSAEGDAAWMQGPFRILFTSIDGLPGLRICHEQLLQEPILELHLALRAANGHILRRRYDLLIDPPQPGSAVTACELPDAAAIAAPHARAERPRHRVGRHAVAAGDSTAEGRLVVPGDTLSEVAQTLRGDRPIALPAMVDALYRANPDAFTGSADRLRAGSHLTMPANLRRLGAEVPATPTAVDVETATPAAAPAAAELPSSAPPDAVPRDWAQRLHMSERLATLPTAIEQGRVAERYLAAMAPPVPVETVIDTPVSTPIAVLPDTRSRDVPTATREIPAWLRNAIAVLIVVLLLGWAVGRKKRTHRRPAAAATPVPVPLPQAVAAPPAPAPVGAPSSAPPPVYSRTQDNAQEVGRDFYDEVAALLIATLQKNPDRRDLRFRLLDLYFTSGRRDAFVEHTRGYLASLAGTADENWPEIVRMGRQIAPESGLYSAHPGEAARATVIPLQGARTGVRRFYENADATALRALREHLDRAYTQLRRDNDFWRELTAVSRQSLAPDPGLTPAERLTQYLGGGRVLFRDERRRDPDEDAALVAIGQVLIARRLGYRRVVAAGMQARHALLAAQAAQRLGLYCVMHLSEAEQAHNAGALQRLIGMRAKIETIPDASFGLAASAQLCALNDALGSHDSLYISPAAGGPSPYPTIVVDLVAMQGRSLRASTTQLPGGHADVLITHSGDGVHTLGTIEAFLDAVDTRLLCMESDNRPHDGLTFQREHRLLRATGRVDYQHIAEEAARFTTQFCAEREYAKLGPAGSEVFAAALRAARDLSASQSVVAVLPSEMTATGAQLAGETDARGDAMRVVPLPRA
ncbi:tryptophan synthase beta subunit [Panacagrimonas perspica]|uniref:Tryptophan synthase beta subunit n=1 Tax=Panacagrimonas perspica TaxID=381431 RepID=A0A4S3K6B2_9GAMM|nr:hypothetical protein [Panacagrimonas perspica]TDU26929.1 tryptophan synthase beta subunit [Panacagrimonas perspica]THD03697.1 hypothetical protein B1810_09135 [Panacagrimonas perspica]